MPTDVPSPRLHELPLCACGLSTLEPGEAVCPDCESWGAGGDCECSACEGPHVGGCDHVCATCLGGERCEACE